MNKYKLGLTLVAVFSALFLLLAFQIVPVLNSLVLGSLGLLSYVLILAGVSVGVFLMLDKDIFLETQEIIFMVIWFLIFVSIIHLATTSDIITYSFADYISNSYIRQVTAGGALFSVLIFPVYSITYIVATYVLLSIALIVLTAVIIDKLHANIQFKKLNTTVKAKRVESARVENSTYKDEKTIKPAKANVLSDDYDEVIISDNEFNEMNKPHKQEILLNKNSDLNSDEDKKKARIILGLSQDEKDLNKNILESAKKSDKELDYNSAQKSGIDKTSYILTPKFPQVKSNATETQDLSTYVNPADKSNKPPKFVHEAFGGNKEATYKNPNVKNKRELSDADKKNLEFLRSSIGGELRKRTNLQQEPEFETNKIVTANENTINNVKLQNNSNFDDYDYYNENIYDENLTSKNYSDKLGQNVKDFINKPVEQNFENKNSNNLRNSFINDKPVFVAKPKENNGFYNNGSAVNNTEKNQQINNYKKNKKSVYIKPGIDLLKEYPQNNDTAGEDYTQKATMLEQTLNSFKIPAKVVSITKGPAFTRFELQIPQGIPVKKVTSYIDNIAMTLESQGAVRVEIPIPGKNAFGVEVPNEKISTVGLKDILDSYSFNSSKSLLTFALGKDITGDNKVARLDKMPHLLIAGSTGSGKSVCLNTLLISLLFKASPDDLRIILIDPKRVEFTLYNELPHLLIPNVITELDKALSAFSWVIDEMERRFIKFAHYKVKNLDEFNALDQVSSGIEEKLPYIIIVVDELADLMVMSKKELEEKIIRIAQKSRAAGIHLVLATQRPSVDVITGIIKANLPSRISFAVSSFVDSKTILDQAGAEKLLGKGDMLYYPNDMPDPVRIQGAFVSTEEVENVINFIKANNETDYDSDIEDKMFSKKNISYDTGGGNEEFDSLFKEAVRLIVKTGGVSTTRIQRRFGIGYPRAAKIVDQMEFAGFVSEPDNSKMRQVFITQQEFEERFGEDL